MKNRRPRCGTHGSPVGSTRARTHKPSGASPHLEFVGPHLHTTAHHKAQGAACVRSARCIARRAGRRGTRVVRGVHRYNGGGPAGSGKAGRGTYPVVRRNIRGVPRRIGTSTGRERTQLNGRRNSVVAAQPGSCNTSLHYGLSRDPARHEPRHARAGRCGAADDAIGFACGAAFPV